MDTPAVTPDVVKAVSQEGLSRNLKYPAQSKLRVIYIRRKRLILYLQILGNGNTCPRRAMKS